MVRAKGFGPAPWPKKGALSEEWYDSPLFGKKVLLVGSEVARESLPNGLLLYKCRLSQLTPPC
jgi:hypothetical protein